MWYTTQGMEHSVFPILSAKVQVPPLPEVYLPLPRIEQLLLPTRQVDPDQPVPQGYEFRALMYLSAPPGYGKTSCLVRLAEQCGITHAWISLDALDIDLRRASIYLHEALRVAGLPEPLPAGDGGAPVQPNSDEQLLAALHRIETFEKPFLLLIDDAHEVAGSPFFTTLRGFLEYLPRNCRVVIATREDLPLPLSRHRQADRLVELRQETLQAEEQEARAYLRLFGVDLSEDELRLIWRRTAGWWACLKLFCISWRKLDESARRGFLEKFRASDRFIAEFLLESVYTTLPPQVARYAAAAAVPEFFNEDLAQLLYVSSFGKTLTRAGEPEAAPQDGSWSESLLALRRMNLLTQRSGEHTARYRFHPLFREYLRHTLTRETRAVLHSCTAEWFAAAGLGERARRHQENAQRLTRGEHPVSDGAQLGEAAAPPEAASPPEAMGNSGLFSRRERELIGAVSLGLSNEEIATKLYISTGTVKWHLNNIYGKLGARNRTDALLKARALGLLD